MFARPAVGDRDARPGPAPSRPVRSIPSGRSGVRWSVGRKFFLILAVVGVCIVAVVGVGVLGLGRLSAQARALFSDSVTQSQLASELHGAVDDAGEATRELTIPGVLPGRVIELDSELTNVLIPNVSEAMAALTRQLADEHAEQLSQLETAFQRYRPIANTIADNARNGPPDAASTDAASPDPAAEAAGLLQGMAVVADQIRAAENAEAELSADQAEQDSHSSAVILLAVGGVSLILALLVVLGLIRNLMPRIRDYSHFATEVAAGGRPGLLNPRGADELAELGRALNDMVERNRLHTEREELQTEFVDTLQVTATEDEAHDLTKRHIERVVPYSAATVLTRNNSANRLQSATALASGSVLSERLVGAEPRSCLSVRFARPHQEGTGRAPLLNCALCADLTFPSTCEPLLVGGVVIGSVLVTHDQPLTDDAAHRIKTTVIQAAPVLANLRNLALAEFRANNDSLTGLPNIRATDDTFKRMVAQANRSITPLAAVMFDLDHFKQINDRFGHGKGDEVLAAVGAALQSCLRGSDFAGRFGGEEFLILLPDSTTDGALKVAEKIRQTVAAIVVPGVEHAITASLGVAGLPENAGNADGLMREADRALYAAKFAGRNQTVTASTEVTPVRLLTDDVPALTGPATADDPLLTVTT